MARSSPAPARDAHLAALRLHCGGSEDRLRETLRALGPDDTRGLLLLSARHRTEPLVARALDRLDARDVPDALAEPFRAAARTQALDALRQLDALGAIADGFARDGLGWALLKGLALSLEAYGDALAKSSIDIDLLVARPDLRAAFAALRRLGFRPRTPEGADDDALLDWHGIAKESVWSDSRGIQLDLHHALGDRPDSLPLAGRLPPLVSRQIGEGVTVPVLRRDWQVAHLAVHGASSGWFRWKWLTDASALLHRLGGEREAALDAAAALGPRREVALMADLAVRSLGVGTVEPVDARVAFGRQIVRAYLAGPLSRGEPTGIAGGTLPIHLLGLILAPSPPREALRILRRARINR